MPWQVLPPGTLATLTDANLATILRGDAQIPRFFMTGDGHRSPPFAWTMRCDTLKVHFLTLMTHELLCAHVEEYPKDVSLASVPVLLQLLYGQQRIFGWELPIYRDLQPIMEKCLELVGSSLVPAEVIDDVVALDKEIVRMHALLWQIGNPNTLRDAMAQSLIFRQYYREVCKGKAPRNLGMEAHYRQFLLGYNNAAMDLRTGVNRFIGNNIQRIINQYPDCTHIITCGDAHITHDPLYQYVHLPPGKLGVVDASQM